MPSCVWTRLLWVTAALSVIPFSLADAQGARRDRVQELITQLKEPEANDALAAGLKLVTLGSEAVVPLTEVLRDPKVGARRSAAWVLGQIGPAAVSSAPRLIDLLSDADSSVRAAAASALGGIGPGAEAAVPRLVALLSDSDPSVQAGASSGLGGIGAKAAPGVAGLADLLSHQDSSVRAAAASALGGIGQPATPGVNSLLLSLDDDHGPVRLEAALSIARIAPREEIVPTLVSALGQDVRAHFAFIGLADSLRARGRSNYTVVPRVYARELTALLVLLVAWFLLARRYPRTKPNAKPLQFAHVAAVALVPTLTAGAAVYYATTREWAQGFIPDPVLTVLPFPVAAVLSVAFVCVLAAIWACQRKPVEGGDEPEAHTEGSNRITLTKGLGGRPPGSPSASGVRDGRERPCG